ncbi:hypothetical protein GUJ93_ZPchr0002g23018 [Zizania palustris]|uniref:RNA polymerase II C-terminal domain phosphatase-like n=1 Tax=Zizania palustris TaxID=103762 RepID=A0A8J5RIX3_ZIZPA|nr:hypothetical protein GUJ93_ZPchr0002g23018 [Zizania palustris]
MDPSAAADAIGGMEAGGEDASARGCPNPGVGSQLLLPRGQKKDDGAEDSEQGSGAGEASGHSLGYISDDSMTLTELGTKDDHLASLLLSKKLILVLDLDHTLINSTGVHDLSPIEQANGFSQHTGDDPGKGLFRLNSLSPQMFAKLRPFVRGFLQQANAMFEMHVYTLGKRRYAWEIAKLLDPDGVYFGERIISCEESTKRNRKNLDVVVPADENVVVVILDDRKDVWKEHNDNLIEMEKYLYFASSCRNYNTMSLAELNRDEREHDGALTVILDVLRRVHECFFHSVCGAAFSDVREVIRLSRQEVLSGCTLAFCRVKSVNPLDSSANYQQMRQRAKHLGADCTAKVVAAVTHVVATDRTTHKARWALENGKFLVSKKWIDAAHFRWSKPNEQNFPVTGGS